MHEDKQVNSPADRPARPSIAELRAVTQPPEILSRANSEHWVADLYGRKVSPYLTRAFLGWGFTPNVVTALMILCAAGAGFALLIPGIPGAALAVLLAQLQMVIDSSDGEVARWQRRFSPAGIFLDKIGHYTAETLIPLMLGIRAAGMLDWKAPGGIDAAAYAWAYTGALLAILVIFNKALNDMAHVARAFSGLPRLADSREAGRPTHSGLARLRGAVRYFPFNRIYHSVELTLLILLAAVGDALTAGLAVTRGLLVALLVLGVPTVVGHILAIMTSSRLRGPATGPPPGRGTGSGSGEGETSK
ncbi:MAG: CDP-alcohol phosphatidyltransferase family protein [Candidatus Nanopelagicales bacterium]